jgi:hypothetical protein
MTLQRSDLSGESLEAERVDHLRISSGGRARILTVSASEAEQLLTKGKDAGPLRGALPRLRRVALWLLALLVASWVLPALTRQWSDRQAELTLKTSLLTRMSEGLSATIAGAESLLRQDPPQKKAERTRDDLLMNWQEADANNSSDSL